MRNPDHAAVALLYALDALGNEFKHLGQVVIDEWFGVDIGEVLTVAPRRVGLFGQDQQTVVQFDESTAGDIPIVRRVLPTRPWLRAKKGSSRQ